GRLRRALGLADIAAHVATPDRGVSGFQLLECRIRWSRRADLRGKYVWGRPVSWRLVGCAQRQLARASRVWRACRGREPAVVLAGFVATQRQYQRRRRRFAGLGLSSWS